jgi:hypothetical protein
MSKKYQLDLQIEGQSNIQIEGELLDEDFKILEMFLMQYDELARSGPLQRGLPCHIVLNFNETEGLSSTGELPSKDDLSILLHLLRPFILHNEPASFNRACGILKKQFSNPHLRILISQEQEVYTGRRLQRIMKISSDEVIINSEKVLNDWLNSYEYHRDLSKRQTIDKLFEYIPKDFLKGLLVCLVFDKVDAIRDIAKIIRTLFGKEPKLTFKI